MVQSGGKRERRRERRGVCGKKKKRAGTQVGCPGMSEHSREKDSSGVQSEHLGRKEQMK